MTAFPALINDMTKRIQTCQAYFVIYTQIPTCLSIHICRFKLLSMDYTLIWKLLRRQKHSFHLALHRPPIPSDKYGFQLFLSICRNFVQYILHRQKDYRQLRQELFKTGHRQTASRVSSYLVRIHGIKVLPDAV